MTTEQLGLWTIDRAARLDELITESNEIIDRAIAFAGQWEIAGIIGMFSGGNDSTVLAHLLRDRVTHYFHANTQVGAEPTRQYVRDMCARWGIPLIERSPDSYGYEQLVLGQCPTMSKRAKYANLWPGGFPGPRGHRTFFGHLKDRGIRQMHRELVTSPRIQRIVQFNGRRGEESPKRAQLRTRLYRKSPCPWQMERSEITVSPILSWTKLDLNEYRRRFDLPRNETADLMHKSMECACGCYAADGEMAEMETWLPELADYLHGLEWRLRQAQLDINPQWLTWGWANDGRCALGICNV